MITLIARLLGGSTVAAWAALIALAIAGLGGGALYVHHRGYAAGNAAAMAAVAKANDAERKRQADANASAKATQDKIISDLQADKTRLEQIIQENADAADKDPRRDACGVGADGVRRLRRVQ